VSIRSWCHALVKMLPQVPALRELFLAIRLKPAVKPRSGSRGGLFLALFLPVFVGGYAGTASCRNVRGGIETTADARRPAPECCCPAQASAAPLTATSAAGYPAISADAFVDSVGVNVHLHYTDTAYVHFDLVEKALKDLGVRHIRDKLMDTSWSPYYDRLNTLGRAGIKAVLITSPEQSDAVLVGYPGRVLDSFEAYEGPNEYDQSKDPNWAASLTAFLARLCRAVRSNPATSHFPILGPSLTYPASFPKLAATSPYFDYANLHNYFGGRNPGTPGWDLNDLNGHGSYAWHLDLADRAWPGTTVISTETGYFNDPAKADAVPENVAGTYMPRLLFEQWMHGIKRTYLYELVDIGPVSEFTDATYGLLRSDFSPKPSYNAVKSVLRLLSDPGPSFRAGNLNFELAGELTDVHHLLLEKRNGTFYLAIWIEESGYDVAAKAAVPVPEHTIVVTTRDRVRMNLHILDQNGQMRASVLRPAQRQRMAVSDRVSILEIIPERSASRFRAPMSLTQPAVGEQ